MTENKHSHRVVETDYGWSYFMSASDACGGWAGLSNPYYTEEEAKMALDEYLKVAYPPPLGIHIRDGVGADDKVGG